jgi:hypothetical protein
MEGVLYLPIWLLYLGACVIIVYLTFKSTGDLQLESNLCLLLDPSRTVWDKQIEWYLFCCLVVHNTLCLTILTSCYAALLFNVWKVAYGAMAKSSTKTSSTVGMIKVAILAWSALISYIPILILYLIRLNGDHINQSVISWTFIVTMPISSIVNPAINSSLFTKEHSLVTFKSFFGQKNTQSSKLTDK